MTATRMIAAKSALLGLMLSLAVFGDCQMTPAATHNSSWNRGAGLGQKATPSPNRSLSRSETLIKSCIEKMDENTSVGAEACFQHVLREDPSNIAAHTYLGMLADKKGDLPRAASQFALAVKSSPESAAARNNYGVVLLRQGKKGEAAKQFEASLHLDPSQSATLANLAQIYFARGTPTDLQRARDLLSRARAVASDGPILRSLVVVDLGLSDKKAAARDYEDYAAFVSSASKSTPESMAGDLSVERRQLGDSLIAANLIREGTRELEAALALNPSDPESVLHLARAQNQVKQFSAAGRTLESALSRGVVSAVLYALLADVYEASGHIENAVPAMLLAIETDPHNEAYRFRYGMLLVDTKAPQAGIIRLQEAIKFFPESPRLWFGLGLAQFQDHKNHAAENSFEHALQLDSKYVPALTYLGLLALDAGRYKEARSYYQRAIAVNPKLGVLRYLKAEAIQKEQAGNAAEAEKELVLATNIDPNFAPARLLLGKIYLGDDRKEDAVTQFKEAIRIDPELAEAHYHLGRAYQRQKQTAAAKAQFDLFKNLSAAEKDRSVKERRDLVAKLANVEF